MYEVVKTVNGHNIYRMVGSRRFYHIRINAHKEVTFHTIKAAAEWAETH